MFYSESSDKRDMKIWLTILLLFGGPIALAQVPPPKFQPPTRPLDADFDDPVEEELDGDPARMGMPSVPPPNFNHGQPPPAPPPNNDFHPIGGSGGGIGAGGGGPAGNGKVRFQIVDGEFYEKGKPRGRAPIDRR